jgi:hypothetical protein
VSVLAVAALLLAYGACCGALGAAAAWWSRGDTLALLRAQLADARQAETLAVDRLLAAWRDGVTIPPAPTPPAPPLEPLPALLQEAVDDWEDTEHRQALEAEARHALATGQSPAAILRAWTSTA